MKWLRRLWEAFWDDRADDYYRKQKERQVNGESTYC